MTFLSDCSSLHLSVPSTAFQLVLIGVQRTFADSCGPLYLHARLPSATDKARRVQPLRFLHDEVGRAARILIAQEPPALRVLLNHPIPVHDLTPADVEKLTFPFFNKLPVAFEKVNGVNAVFLLERYSIYQHLSAKGTITI
jgi:hypothetical protein